MSKAASRLARRVRGVRFTGLIAQSGQTLMRMTMDLQDLGFMVHVEVEDGGLRMPMRFYHEFVQDGSPPVEGPSISFLESSDQVVRIVAPNMDRCIRSWEEWSSVLEVCRRDVLPARMEYNLRALRGQVLDKAAVRRNLGIQLFALVEQDHGIDVANELIGQLVDGHTVEELAGMVADRRQLSSRIQAVFLYRPVTSSGWNECST